MSKNNKFSSEVRERAVGMVQEHRGEYLMAWQDTLVTDGFSGYTACFDKRDLGAMNGARQENVQRPMGQPRQRSWPQGAALPPVSVQDRA